MSAVRKTIFLSLYWAILVGAWVSATQAQCPENPAPQNDYFPITRNAPLNLDVLANDRHPCGIPMSIGELTLPPGCQGQLVRNFDQTLTYTPLPGLEGLCQLTYTVTDQEDKTATAILELQLAVPASPTLTVHPQNPRYAANSEGKALYLAGAHVWNNLQDYGPGPNPPADCGSHACGAAEWQYLKDRGHNFTRGWHWEQASGFVGANGWVVTPIPFKLAGNGKYDLDQYDEAYFTRLHERVQAAQARGLFLSIMLFEGWSVQSRWPGGENPWLGHPFHPNNNNTLSFDPDLDGDGAGGGDGGGEEIHTLNVGSAVLDLQKAYITKVVEELNSYDNIFWEICNECGDSESPRLPNSAFIAWMDAMASHIRSVEASMPRQHLVWISAPYGGSAPSQNSQLLATGADIVSLKGDQSANAFHLDPAPHGTESGKIILLDSDHLYNPTCVDWNGENGWCGQGWAFKAFTRGYNPILLDTVRSPFPGLEEITGNGAANARVELERRALGQTVFFANEVIQDLAAMSPQGDLCTTNYCLADPGEEYLVFQPASGAFQVSLPPGDYRYTFYSSTTGALLRSDEITVTAANPMPTFAQGGEQLVLYISRLHPGTPLSLTDPADAQAIDGDSVFFSVTASGGQGAISYQWQISPDGLSWTDLAGPPYSGTTQATLVIDPVTESLDGHFFRCRVSDDQETLLTQAAQLTVEPAACSLPIPGPDALTVEHGETTLISDEWILGNDSGVDLGLPADPSQWVVTPPAGVLTPLPEGGWSYTTPTEYQATDSFTYRVISGGDDSCAATGMVTITIQTPVCQNPPIPGLDEITLVHGSPPFYITDEFILGNDEGHGETLRLPPDDQEWVVDAPSGQLEAQFQGGWLYSTPTEYQAADTFTYRVVQSSDLSCSAVGTVSITIEPAPCGNPPTAVDDQVIAVIGGGPVVISDEFIFANDLGTELSHPSATDDWVVTQPAGTLVEQIPGGWVYSPPATFQPSDSFEYRVIQEGDENCSDIGRVEISMLEADFTRTCTDLTCTFDASSSTGEIIDYHWQFGDGTTTGGAQNTVQHEYPGQGLYDVTLTVTATDGAATATKTLATEPILGIEDQLSVVFGSTLTGDVSQLIANDLGPELRFTDFIGLPGAGTLQHYLTTFEYTPSQCLGGDAVGYRLSSQRETYSSAQSQVAFTILPDAAPIPGFSHSCDGGTCHFTDESSDDSGYQVISWDFGDAGSGGGSPSVSHTYPASGDYLVTLTIRDLCEQTRSTSQTISVLLPPAPAFTFECFDLDCHFEVEGAPDPGGESYAWDFGDGTSASTAAVQHSFAAEGEKTVTLTVTPSSGPARSVTRSFPVFEGEEELWLILGGGAP